MTKIKHISQTHQVVAEMLPANSLYDLTENELCAVIGAIHVEILANRSPTPTALFRLVALLLKQVVDANGWGKEVADMENEYLKIMRANDR